MNKRFHYLQYKIQFWDIDHFFNFGALSVIALKYIGRFEDKNGLEDIEKCIYTTTKLKEKMQQYQTGLYRVGFNAKTKMIQDFTNQFISFNSNTGQELRTQIVQAIINENLDKAIELLNKLKRNYAKIYERFSLTD